jgi:hypothetical protein
MRLDREQKVWIRTKQADKQAEPIIVEPPPSSNKSAPAPASDARDDATTASKTPLRRVDRLALSSEFRMRLQRHDAELAGEHHRRVAFVHPCNDVIERDPAHPSARWQPADRARRTRSGGPLIREAGRKIERLGQALLNRTFA